MSFNLGKIVPWGRSFDEYVKMFALSKNEKNRTEKNSQSQKTLFPG